MIPRNPISIDAAGLSDLGHKRTQNEDQFLIASLKRSMLIENTSLPLKGQRMLEGSVEGTVLMVADGMGGEGGGQVASSIAVNTIAEYVCNVMPWVVRHTSSPTSARPRMTTLPEIRQGLLSAFEQGDSNILRLAHEEGHSARMGTTLTLAYVLWPGLYVAHAGDSRCYLFRNDNLAQLTKDHTVAQQMADHGIHVDEDSQLHHVLWNALGGGGDNKLLPEVQRFNLEPGDIILLCSDGLTKEIEDEQIAEVLRQGLLLDSTVTALGPLADAIDSTLPSAGVRPVEKMLENAPGPRKIAPTLSDESTLPEGHRPAVKLMDAIPPTLPADSAAAKALVARALRDREDAADPSASTVPGDATATFAERCCRRLIDLAKTAGGSDNITVVVAKLG